MNLSSYIRSFTDKPYFYYDENWFDEENYPKPIIILDCNKVGFQNWWFNFAFRCLDLDGAFFMIGGLPLVYQLVKLRFPILISQEDRNISAVLPYEKRTDYHLDTSLIPKMRPENYWAYLELWNKQGNRNFICEKRFLDHILWNRFNKPVKFL